VKRMGFGDVAGGRAGQGSYDALTAWSLLVSAACSEPTTLRRRCLVGPLGPIEDVWSPRP
jgi:hypothetical protein